MENETPILKCSGLWKRYGPTPALQDLNLSLPKGKIVGLLGPNGSGKTTLLKLTAGLLTPSAGSLTVDGLTPGIETKRIVSYLPDNNYLPGWMKVADILSLFADFYPDFDTAKAREMLAQLQIQEKMRFKNMSKGTKEKLQLILAMSRNAKLYLLDEPIGGVDPATRDYILNTIIQNYSENATVLISTHLIADIEQVLEEFLFIAGGRCIMQDSVDNIRETQGKSIDTLFREVFKC